MDPEYDFPFQFVDNSDLMLLIGSSEFVSASEEAIPLNELNKMCYNPINSDIDGYLGDVDPDNFLQGSMGLDVPSCEYYFPGTPEFALNLDENTFSVIHLNIGSIPKNLDTFIDQCIAPLNQEFDVLGFCETKLTNDIDQLYDIPRYSRYCNNISRQSGGVALYIRDKYNSNERVDLRYREEPIESIFVEVDGYCIVGVIYRRPNTNVRDFLEKLNDLLLRLKTEKRYVIL